MTLSSSPATAVWWDAAATKAAVLAQLRLQVGDVDESRITSLIPAAGFLIDNYVDRCEPLPGPPADPVLQGVLEQVTVELYRRKDAPPSSSSDWSSGPGSFRFGAVDPIGEVITQLAPYKQRHGIA